MTPISKLPPPIRFIEVRQVQSHPPLWQAVYPGDEWTEAFRTKAHEWQLMERGLRQNDVSHGLPILYLSGLHEALAA